jgi:hypothetical protein
VINEHALNEAQLIDEQDLCQLRGQRRRKEVAAEQLRGQAGDNLFGLEDGSAQFVQRSRDA